MRIDLSHSSMKTLFVTDLEPPAHLLEKTRGLDHESEIRLLFTKHNRISIREPVVLEMTEPITPETLRSLNLKWSKPPSFFTVCTTVGCLPDKDCRFTWLRVEFNLGSELINTDIRPVACKLYPEFDKDEIKEIKSFEISSQFSFNIPSIETSLTGNFAKKKEYPSYRYKLITHGNGSSRPAWDFRVTEVNPEIAGDITLLFIVALQPDIATAGEISVSAEVQLRTALPKFPLIMKRSDGVKNNFRLCTGTVHE